VPGVPGTTTGATVVADTAVVVVSGVVVVGAIEAAAEQPPARAVLSLPQYQGIPEPSGQVPPKYPANEPDARATVVVVVDVVVDVVAVGTVVVVVVAVVAVVVVEVVVVEIVVAEVIGVVVAVLIVVLVVAVFDGIFMVAKLTKLIVCIPTVLTASAIFLATPCSLSTQLKGSVFVPQTPDAR
jgi:hypothetical protein